MKKILKFITVVYALFTVVVWAGVVVVCFIFVSVGDTAVTDYLGKLFGIWFLISMFVYPAMSIAYKIPSPPSVPVPRWRQRYVVNHWYDPEYLDYLEYRRRSGRDW